MRLFDYTAESPVAGGGVCLFNPDETAVLRTRVRTEPFALPHAAHEYALEAMGASGSGPFGGGPSLLFTARLIAEWTEKGHR